MAELAGEGFPISEGDGRQVVLRVDEAGFLGASRRSASRGAISFLGAKVRRSCGR